MPDDLLLVGFDDAPWTTLVSPQLTVVAQPTHEIGRQAARLLATASADLPARHVVLPASLRPRQLGRLTGQAPTSSAPGGTACGFSDSCPSGSALAGAGSAGGRRLRGPERWIVASSVPR